MKTTKIKTEKKPRATVKSNGGRFTPGQHCVVADSQIRRAQRLLEEALATLGKAREHLTIAGSGDVKAIKAAATATDTALAKVQDAAAA